MAFVAEPRRVNPLLRLGIRISERITGKPMMPARLLAWVPRAALGSAALESLVTHHDRTVSDRTLKLVRITASFTAQCPFCIDMNSFEYDRIGITDPELSALRAGIEERLSTLTEREQVAIRYARLISATPLDFPPEFITRLHVGFHGA